METTTTAGTIFETEKSKCIGVEAPHCSSWRQEVRIVLTEIATNTLSSSSSSSSSANDDDDNHEEDPPHLSKQTSNDDVPHRSVSSSPAGVLRRNASMPMPCCSPKGTRHQPRVELCWRKKKQELKMIVVVVVVVVLLLLYYYY